MKHVVRNMNLSKEKKMIKMEINAGLRFGNIYMSGLRRSSRPSQFRWKQVFFVLHKVETVKDGDISWIFNYNNLVENTSIHLCYNSL